MIKEYIIPKLLKNLTNQEAIEKRKRMWENYWVDCLALENCKFKSSDFIAKFMDMNKTKFHSLSLN